MGRKRKKDSEDRIQKKIRKLEKKLTKQRVRVIYSSDDDENVRESTPSDGRLNSPMELDLELEVGETPSAQPDAGGAATDADSPGATATPRSPADPDIRAPGASQPRQIIDPAAAEDETPEPTLDEDILQLLGEAPTPETVMGRVVHKDIAARYLEIVKKGLTKETKDKLFKEYPVPSNCELFLPPILNPEVKAALTDNFVKRDASLELRQKYLSLAISALTSTIDNIVLNNDLQNVRNNLLKPISDACRILCYMHHYETDTRKKFVYSSINSQLKDALNSSKTDKYLFGGNISDRLKAAQTVQRSGEVLLKASQRSAIQRNATPSTSYNYRNQENYKPLHPRRPAAGKFQTAAAPRPAAAAYARARYPAARPSPAPPAPRQPPPPAPQPRRTARR